MGCLCTKTIAGRPKLTVHPQVVRSLAHVTMNFQLCVPRGDEVLYILPQTVDPDVVRVRVSKETLLQTQGRSKRVPNLFRLNFEPWPLSLPVSADVGDVCFDWMGPFVQLFQILVNMAFGNQSWHTSLHTTLVTAPPVVPVNFQPFLRNLRRSGIVVEPQSGGL